MSNLKTKKSLWLGLLLVMVLVIISSMLLACAGPAKPTESTASPTTPAPKPVKAVYATYFGPEYPDFFKGLTEHAGWINEHGKGMFEIEMHHSSTLLDAKELMPGLLNGTCDMIMLANGNFSSTFPALAIDQLPFLWEDGFHLSRAAAYGAPMYDLINGELAKKNLYIFTHAGSSPNYLWTKKPVNKLEDLKGMSIRGAGMLESRTLTSLGAGCVSMPSGEMYLAAQRGTITGAICPILTAHARSLKEVMAYVIPAKLGDIGASLAVRRDWWDAQPQKIKDLLTQSGVQAWNPRITELVNKGEVPQWKELSATLKVINISVEEEARWRTACEPVYQYWKGLVGEDVYNKVMTYAEMSRKAK